MANRYTVIRIGQNGQVSINDQRSKVSASQQNLAAWIFNNQSGYQATAYLSNWVINKVHGNINSGTPVTDPITWLFPEVDGVVTIDNGRRQLLVGIVTAVVPAQGQTFSCTLTVVVNGVEHSYDPDLEVPPPGGVIIVPGGGDGRRGRSSKPQRKKSGR